MACQYKAKVIGFILGNIPNCCWSSYEYGKKGLLILVKAFDFNLFIKD